MSTQSRKIISGGQTGVDRAGLDAAMKLGIPHGGWCPLGRKAEDGVIPTKYKLTEGPIASYPWRTEKNVQDSNITLIYCHDVMKSRGTALTVKLCKQYGRPHIDVIKILSQYDFPEFGYETIAQMIRGHSVINVAGPRESTNPGIHEAARDRFVEIFNRLINNGSRS